MDTYWNYVKINYGDVEDSSDRVDGPLPRVAAPGMDLHIDATSSTLASSSNNNNCSDTVGGGGCSTGAIPKGKSSSSENTQKRSSFFVLAEPYEEREKKGSGIYRSPPEEREKKEEGGGGKCHSFFALADNSSDKALGAKEPTVGKGAIPKKNYRDSSATVSTAVAKIESALETPGLSTQQHQRQRDEPPTRATVPPDTGIDETGIRDFDAIARELAGKGLDQVTLDYHLALAISAEEDTVAQVIEPDRRSRAFVPAYAPFSAHLHSPHGRHATSRDVVSIDEIVQPIAALSVGETVSQPPQGNSATVTNNGALPETRCSPPGPLAQHASAFYDEFERYKARRVAEEEEANRRRQKAAAAAMRRQQPPPLPQYPTSFPTIVTATTTTTGAATVSSTPNVVRSGGGRVGILLLPCGHIFSHPDAQFLPHCLICSGQVSSKVTVAY